MHAAHIVTLLLDDISAEEFLDAHEEWLHGLEIAYDRIGIDNGVPVYYGAPDSHYYIGTIRQWPAGWRAYEVNPKYRPGRYAGRFIVNTSNYYPAPASAAIELKAEWEKT